MTLLPCQRSFQAQKERYSMHKYKCVKGQLGKNYIEKDKDNKINVNINRGTVVFALMIFLL